VADTGAQLITKVKFNLGDRDDKDVVILVAINNAVARLAALHNWRNLEETHHGTLAADTETMTLPEYTKTLISCWYVKDDNSYSIQPTTAFRHDKQTKGGAYGGITTHVIGGETRSMLDSGNRGVPRIWFIFGNALHFYPIPTEETEIWLRVIKKPDTITEGVEHNLGEQMNRTIVLFATSEMYASLGIHDDAAAWESRGFQSFREVRSAEKVDAWTPKGMIDGVTHIS